MRMPGKPTSSSGVAFFVLKNQLAVLDLARPQIRRILQDES